MAPLAKLPPPRSGVGMAIVAHRGNMALEPENSVASFRRAIEEGADLLETDLRLSSDGEFVCFHDSTLERTSTATGQVSGKSLAELREIGLRRKGDLHSEEKIPTLKDLAANLSDSVSLALELKDRLFADSAVCAKLVRELRNLGLLDRTMVLASSRKKVLAMREADPIVPIGFVSFALAPADSVELLGPYWPLLFVNPFYVRWAHRRGIIVCPLDPKPDRRLALYRALGCDALLTDNPGATIAALRKIEARA